MTPSTATIEVWYDKSVQRFEARLQVMEDVATADALRAQTDLLIEFVRHESRQLPAVVSGYRELMLMADQERDERTAALAKAVEVIQSAGESLVTLTMRVGVIEERQDTFETTRSELMVANNTRLLRIERAQADMHLSQWIVLVLVFTTVLHSTYVVVDGAWGATVALVVIICQVTVALYYATTMLYLHKRRC